MTEQELKHLIEVRAYQIYVRRTQSPLWDWGRMGQVTNMKLVLYN